MRIEGSPSPTDFQGKVPLFILPQNPSAMVKIFVQVVGGRTFSVTVPAALVKSQEVWVRTAYSFCLECKFLTENILRFFNYRKSLNQKQYKNSSILQNVSLY